MSYIVDLLKEKYLDKVKTTKDLIYKDKTISPHKIAESYEKLVSEGEMMRFPLDYNGNKYYVATDKEYINIQTSLLHLNEALVKHIKSWIGETVNINSFKESEIFNSLWIEGVKSSKKKIKQLVKNINIDLKGTAEKLSSNYNDALNFILKTEQINELNLLTLYNLLSRDIELGENKLESYPYREGDVEISNETEMGIDPTKVKGAMDSLFEIINQMSNLKPQNDQDKRILLFFIILTHYHFELVHPYYDMNGRMGRLVALWAAKICGIFDDFLYFSEAINMFKKELYYNAFTKSKEKEFKFDATYFANSIFCAMIAQKMIYLSALKIENKVKDKFKKNFSAIQQEIIMSLLSKNKDQFYKAYELVLGIDEINPGQISAAFSDLVEWGLIKETNTKPKEYKLVWTKEMIEDFTAIINA